MNQTRLQLGCDTTAEARRIVAVLLEHNVPASRIQVISGEPIHGLPAPMTGKSRATVFVLSGAGLGIGLGAAMAIGTARLYPLATGGMPIVPALPTSIIMYEAMMLVAILATLGGLLLEARLMRRLPADYSTWAGAVANGEIVILVSPRSAAEADTLSKILLGGTTRVETAHSQNK